MTDEYRFLVSVAANQAQALSINLASAGRFEPLYLSYRRSQPGRSGSLLFVADSETAPEGFELVTGEGLRGDVPYANYWQWTYDRAKRAPILSI